MKNYCYQWKEKGHNEIITDFQASFFNNRFICHIPDTVFLHLPPEKLIAVNT